MNYLRVKNWEAFQHYKDRSPPWIKLHRDLLRDYDFIRLQDASKLHLMLIWLLASQMDNKIPADERYIRNQIGVTGEIDFNELIDKGFLIDDSNTLARRKQSAIGETETETETETDSNASRKKRAVVMQKPDDVDDQVWSDFLSLRKSKKAPVTKTALSGIRNQAAIAGYTMNQALAECSSRGWTGFKAEWVASKPAAGTESAAERIRRKSLEREAAEGYTYEHDARGIGHE
jgi:hypothetical protein